MVDYEKMELICNYYTEAHITGQLRHNLRQHSHHYQRTHHHHYTQLIITPL